MKGEDEGEMAYIAWVTEGRRDRTDCDLKDPPTTEYLTAICSGCKLFLMFLRSS